MLAQRSRISAAIAAPSRSRNLFSVFERLLHERRSGRFSISGFSPSVASPGTSPECASATFRSGLPVKPEFGGRLLEAAQIGLQQRPVQGRAPASAALRLKRDVNLHVSPRDPASSSAVRSERFQTDRAPAAGGSAYPAPRWLTLFTLSTISPSGRSSGGPGRSPSCCATLTGPPSHRIR